MRSQNKKQSIPRLVRYFLFSTLLLPLTLIGEESDEYPLGSVILELKWKHAFQFAGYYAAIDQGFYKDAGIEVTLIEHLTSKSPTEVLLEGNADYAISGMEIAIHRANDKPVIALAAIFQHSPMAFLVKNDSGIEHAEDFRGRRIMFQKNYQDIALMATLRKVGITENDYEHTPTNFDAFALIREEADAFGGYTTDQGFNLAAVGVPNHYILPRHYGIDFYDDVLVTSESEIQNHPERVKAFLSASLKGWEYALRHQEEIISLILKSYNTQNKSREHLQFEARESRDLIRPILVGIGHMNPARWEHIKDVFIDLGILEEDSDISGLMYQDKTTATPNWFAENWLFLTTAFALLTILFLLVFAVQLRRLVARSTQDLAHSESELRALINVQPAIVLTVSHQGEIFSINQTGLNILGAGSHKEIYDTPLKHLIDPDYIDICRASLIKVFGGEAISMVVKAQTLQQKEIWLDSHAVPFSVTEGQIPKVLIVSYDVSDRIKSEEDKSKLQTELQVARKMEALGLLTGGIAHDFNNLLAIILGYASIAQDQSDGDDRAELLSYFKSISHAGERAKKLVDQMLTFSRGDTEESTSVDLSELIENDLSILTAALPSSIIFKTHIEKNLPSVQLTPTQFSQILMNITINARDAMQGKGTLTIELGLSTITNKTCSACQKDIEGQWMTLSITDTGAGINPKVQERMFEPFFTTKDVGKGSGMGLSVIYGIVHNKKGHIIVQSEEDVGTNFKILFPIEDIEISLAKEDSNILDTPHGKGIEILIIDDEIEYGNFMKKLLDQNGYKAHSTNSPQEALTLFQANPDRFQLVLTDQTMPEMTGAELAMQLREVRQNIPIILCTGYSEHFSKEDADNIDVVYLSKPAKIETLLFQIGKLI